MSRAKGIVVFSGGSAANSLVDVFNNLAQSRNMSISYIIPISDNGGSSSELIRVFGGPAIGDVRSRLVRLIPDAEGSDREKSAIKAFFNHRLSRDASAAKQEWLEIVEARHSLWTNISSSKKELIRSFLNLLNLEIVKRARPSSVFSFEGASIGNLFLTGARLFCGSLESAIYLLSSICNVPPHISVLPAINTNFSHHICAGLANGAVIVGQNNISHPSEPTALPSASAAATGAHTPTKDISDQGSFHASAPTTPRYNPSSTVSMSGSPTGDRETSAYDRIEDANLPGSLPTLRKPYLTVSKAIDADEPLPARISRIWYINPYGQEIRPPANPAVLSTLSERTSTLIYSIGSLYTSIVPSLVLRGVGNAIASPLAGIEHKILILNGSNDRETGHPSESYTATDFVAAISAACSDHRSQTQQSQSANLLKASLTKSSVNPDEYRLYVTHVLYLEGEGAPKVNKEELRGLGIQPVRLYGTRGKGGNELRYDMKALNQTLEAIIGTGLWARGDRTRRNSVET